MTKTKGDVAHATTEYTAIQKAREEGWKTQYDLFKHLTTLSTGSILLFVTFLEDIFTQPKWKLLIGVAFGAFTLSILASLMLMLLFSGYIRNLGRTEKFQNAVKILKVAFLTAIGGFLVGITCLIIFAMKNLYS